MFYKIIQRKRNEWLSREDCPIKSLLAYIERKGAMRDAQIEAIKTYLFLKIACENKPLWRLFSEGNVFKLWQVSVNSFHSDRVEKKITDFNLKGQQQALKGKKEFKPITLSEDGLETIEFLSLDCASASPTAPWHSDSEILIDKLGYVRKNGIDTKAFWDGTITSEQKPLRLKIRNICGDETIFELS